MIGKGFWGGFVKGFKLSSSKKKRDTSNVTSSGDTPKTVQIDTVVMMADQTNATDITKLGTAISKAPDLTAVSGSIVGMRNKHKFAI